MYVMCTPLMSQLNNNNNIKKTSQVKTVPVNPGMYFKLGNTPQITILPG